MRRAYIAAIAAAIVLFLVTTPNTTEILRDYPVTTDSIAERARDWLAGQALLRVGQHVRFEQNGVAVIAPREIVKLAHGKTPAVLVKKSGFLIRNDRAALQDEFTDRVSLGCR